jgi:hypothetical protein
MFWLLFRFFLSLDIYTRLGEVRNDSILIKYVTVTAFPVRINNQCSQCVTFAVDTAFVGYVSYEYTSPSVFDFQNCDVYESIESCVKTAFHSGEVASNIWGGGEGGG